MGHIKTEDCGYLLDSSREGMLKLNVDGSTNLVTKDIVIGDLLGEHGKMDKGFCSKERKRLGSVRRDLGLVRRF